MNKNNLLSTSKDTLPDYHKHLQDTGEMNLASSLPFKKERSVPDKTSSVTLYFTFSNVFVLFF